MRWIEIGDIVRYKPRGNNAVVTAKVKYIEICKNGSKYGRGVDRCDLDKHSEVIISLSNFKWCDKSQIVEIKKEAEEKHEENQ